MSDCSTRAFITPAANIRSGISEIPNDQYELLRKMAEKMPTHCSCCGRVLKISTNTRATIEDGDLIAFKTNIVLRCPSCDDEAVG